MVDFRAGYVPPGVYVNADTSAVTAAAGANPEVVLLVGPSLGYRTYTDYVTFAASGGVVTLTQKGADPTSANIKVVDSSGATVNTANYVIGTPSGTAPDTTLTITANGNTPLNQQLAVTYRYADSAFYAMNQFSDFGTLSSVYGAPFDASGNVVSAISLAAQVAFDNGASNIYCATLNPVASGSPTTAQQYANAYALSNANFEIDLVIPIFTQTVGPTSLAAMGTYAANLVGHLQSCDANGVPRNSIIGVPSNFDSNVTPDQIAALFTYRRVLFVWPNKLNYFNQFSNPPSTLTLGGSYLAAACAGVLCANPVNQGLTRQQVYSFSGIDATIASTLTTLNKNSGSSKGVSVLEKNRAGQLVIRHGVTTDVSSITNREFSIVRAGDSLFTTIQTSLESAALIGTPITADTTLSVKGILAGALETALADDTIQAYSGLAVRQLALPSGDPSVIQATFAYKPTYSLNYITVTFNFDLSSGTISTTDTAGDTGSSSDVSG